MPPGLRTKILKFINDTMEIVLRFHALIGVLVLFALGLIEAWHVIHVALLRS
jgi:hypothetical protein